MTMKDPFVTSPEYRQFISELKARVLSARISVGRAANRDIILLYWDIGRGIVEKQERLWLGQFRGGDGGARSSAVVRCQQKLFPR